MPCRQHGGVHDVAWVYPPGDAKTPTLPAATSAFSFLDVLWRDAREIRSLRRTGERDLAGRVDAPSASMHSNDRTVQASAGIVRTAGGRPAKPAGIGHPHQPRTSARGLARYHDTAVGHCDAQPFRTATRASRSVGDSCTACVSPPYTPSESPSRRCIRQNHRETQAGYPRLPGSRTP